MRQPWFFAPPEAWSDTDVTLPPDESRHATKVLRISPPDVITVMDGQGQVAKCAVSDDTDGSLRAEILDKGLQTRTKPELVVYQGAAKANKLDDVVERLAELGVAEMWSFESERAVVRWDNAKTERLTERWTAICRSAAKQSRNAYVMHAGAGLSWTELARRVAKEPLVLTLWEEATLPMRTVLQSGVDRIAVVVGPEGGLTQTEAEALADAGSPLVSLGPNVLRTENAAMVACSALQFHYGLVG